MTPDLENTVKQWVSNNAGWYGPDTDDEKYPEFENKMTLLLNKYINTNKTVENFLEEAVDVVFEYTEDYYGDSTSFSPEDIKQEFWSTK